MKLRIRLAAVQDMDDAYAWYESQKLAVERSGSFSDVWPGWNGPVAGILRLHPRPPSPPVDEAHAFLARTILFDLELPRHGESNRTVVLGASCGEWSTRRQVGRRLVDELDAATESCPKAVALMGHNLLGHDLPRLRDLATDAKLLNLPVVDTLYLSPLAFPENPYHSLLKGYKLSRATANDPLADARLSGELFRDEWDSLRAHDQNSPGLLSLYRFCFCEASATLRDHGGMAFVLKEMGGRKIARSEAAEIFMNHSAERACTRAGQQVWEELDNLPGEQSGRQTLALAYVAAWLRVAGSNSVIPQWVWREIPEVGCLVRRLRDEPCESPQCSYCLATHDPRTQLRRYFNFEQFRDKPAASGRGLQEQIVRHGMRGGSCLAVLPTGGGKSLCFQLPALVRNFRRGSLTIVISPLQALMRDQVTNLAERTGARVDALYGLLTPLERGRVLREVAMGDISVLYIAPEQLRNKSFRKVVVQREIGGWVFDEAHCLSKWGHDFRPDYLYACRVIREIADEQRADLPPVACMTATAKKDVAAEIRAHFRDELGIELESFAGGFDRDNLEFSVEEVSGAGKRQRVLELCSEATEDPKGSVIVYCATRKATERMATFLQEAGLPARHFHGGLNAVEKKEALDGFLRDAPRVICSTNAFGMGVDKPDVRMVVHADIPGTLENYLQEAGRAGRDQEPSRCVLLFDESDVEDQFRLIKDSEITHADLVQVLRGLRRAGRRASDNGGEFQITSGELLRDEGVDTSFDAEERGADTKVKTAVSWLERAELVQRNLNQTHVFTGKPKVPSIAEAERRLDELKVFGALRGMWLEMLASMLLLDPEEGLTVDELAGLPAFCRWRESQPAGSRASERVSHLILDQLREMTKSGLVQEGTRLTAFVRHGVKNSSAQILDRACVLERELLEIMQEESPDAESGDRQHVSLRRLNQKLLDRGHDSNVEQIRTALRSLSQDERCFGPGVSLTVRPRDQFRLQAHLRGTWPALRQRVERRQSVAGACLRVLLSHVVDRTAPNAAQLIEFSLESLVDDMRGDLMVRALLIESPLEPIERVLLYLHDHSAIILQRGLAIFRAAMSIRLNPDAKGHRYTKSDYEPLREHYAQRTVQVHVMRRYAELGIGDHLAARDLVNGYFTMTNEAFLERFFATEMDTITRPISAAAYRQIVDELRNAHQQEIVTAPATQNQLVLAGPGSGKTRVVVHRCAYLLRVLRVRRSSVLVLCFNRSTALELRRRLRVLLGGKLGGLQIHTYDGLAMRIAGRSFTDQDRSTDKPDFAAVRQEATELLTGKRELGDLEPDELRDRLLSGYRHILVDEYQDIDESQYRLVSAIAGRTLEDKDSKLAILAVGDDDQNIYSWRGSSVEFIRRFEQDYQAQRYNLLENYRSSAPVIDACNQLIGHNQTRMKQEQIRIDRIRASAEPGPRVRQVPITGPAHQIQFLTRELAALQSHNSGRGWNEVAFLARQWRFLEPLRICCRELAIPVRWGREQAIPAWRVRETRRLVSLLRGLPVDQRSIRPADLRGHLALVVRECGANPWTHYLRQIVDLWEEDAGNGRMPSSAFVEFMMSVMVEERQLAMAEEGIYLGTVHSAKGLEFDRVFMLDGGWDEANEGEDHEATRRLFYVGMTRARRHLAILAGPGHPFISEMHGLQLERMELAEQVREGGDGRQVRKLELSDYFIDFAARKPPTHPIHRALAGLQVESLLELHPLGQRTLLRDPRSKQNVAALSAEASAEWGSRQVAEIRVLAMVDRRRDESRPEFRDQCQVDAWELPVVEVLW